MQGLPVTTKLLGYAMLVFAVVRYPAEFWWAGLLGIGVIWYSRLMSRGKLDFWQLCAREPELAYRFFKGSSAWHVFERELPANHRELVPSGEWTGAFRLMVPGIGPIWVFGKDGEYEEDQDEFVETYSSA